MYDGKLNYGPKITWRDIPGIYKRRFSRLWRVLVLNLLAGAVVLATAVLAPLVLGAGALSHHTIVVGLALCIALAISGKLYWESFKLAIGAGRR